MSIVKMNRLSVIGLEEEKDSLFEELMEFGAVELNDQSEKLLSKEWAEIAGKDGCGDRVSELDAKLARVQTVLEMIERFGAAKQPLFAVRKEISRKKYEETLGKQEDLEAETGRLYGLYEQWNDEKTEENMVRSLQASLMPWAAYDLPLELRGTRGVFIRCGVIPAVADAEELKRQVSEVSQENVVTVLGKDQEQQYLSLMYMKSDADKILDVLKTFGYAEAQFKDMKGTVSENLKKLDDRLEECKWRQQKLAESFRAASAGKERLQYYYDSIVVERDKQKASEQLLRTEKAFYFDGWVPQKCAGQVEEILKSHGCWYEITVPDKDEETPVLLENNSMVTPFETITDLYSLPSSKEIDPTPIFSFFYFLFFGMMFADMGYGILLAGVCFAGLKMFKLEGLAYKLVKMLAFCGISTFIWGLLFGSFFGNMIPIVSEMFFGKEIVITPLWFDPISDPMKLLIFSCVIGGIHLFIGLGIKAYLLIRDGQVLDAVEDVFVWYALLIGIVLLLFGGSIVPDKPDVTQVLTEVGKWLAIVGAVGIVGLRAVRGKGIGRAVGLWNLYGATSWLGDVLSYSRLLALGLASAVIAQVFNALGAMLGHGIIAVIGFMVIAVIGHAFNFFINALGTFVHASRLQYVEFFGKFYEGGGTPFEPFKKNTKYVKIVKEEKS